MSCKWIACLVPKDDDDYADMALADAFVSEGDVVNIGRSVAYRCAPGHYFVSDRQKESFEIECGQYGEFFRPSPFPQCVRGMTTQ